MPSRNKHFLVNIFLIPTLIIVISNKTCYAQLSIEVGIPKITVLQTDPLISRYGHYANLSYNHPKWLVSLYYYRSPRLSGDVDENRVGVQYGRRFTFDKHPNNIYECGAGYLFLTRYYSSSFLENVYRHSLYLNVSIRHEINRIMFVRVGTSLGFYRKFPNSPFPNSRYGYIIPHLPSIGLGFQLINKNHDQKIN